MSGYLELASNIQTHIYIEKLHEYGAYKNTPTKRKREISYCVVVVQEQSTPAVVGRFKRFYDRKNIFNT